MNPNANGHFSWEHDPTIDRYRSGSAASAVPPDADVWQKAWDLKRDPPRPNDLKLSSLATRWLDDMPDGAKPAALCKRYPRIANRLALCWTDAHLAGLLLEELLQDRRGGRRGFPTDVRAELVRLAADVRRRGSAR